MSPLPYTQEGIPHAGENIYSEQSGEPAAVRGVGGEPRPMSSSEGSVGAKKQVVSVLVSSGLHPAANPL